MNRLKEKYFKEVVPALKREFKLKHDLAVPRITKIVLNLGIKDGAGDKGVAKKVTDMLSQIAGQKAVTTLARKAEAAFKIRLNDPIGAMATLRAERMYEFLDKLLSLVLPRVRDFSGVSKTSFDGRGNYSLGFREQIVFHEVDYDTIDSVRGLQLTIVTNAGDDKKALRLLELLGMPWQK
ncbi:50S ribosomal protein L5 [Candidatus Beckwithbacteria bacterium CG22_combo_CG10-13_8_21_14_all_01_47_9]|uniref:Large ribosomal subunit protein uL5 n=5 Tax=Candidatus Beckwithiibacteriota TaxID=1752726 RepID=A0A2H0E0P5_9BACT|nr:MAG: 50S ribosomal protein L5 [Candidatus Beckwithbacteria bacterium CG1_02_47_37]PIP52429.1 MAG: 50S ribosomal protein L5 [Candidatus Beckwithbacteria bacterium CG23_combo_of_CG06-09_8_20_14_all_47_9]PIP87996.1 MAG: 50S ribosomal protein L5 [Candidatus Beckwithbacteria bacterium CG22_combo_CG10-13_8_21_14_all_01_47_9]PJA21779.1 MAG: 50S ribosomal protein L5 [Candidatus Beckwithbacteria bacterium CG_4_10_14_0_2_um_filter_47_25]PJC66513.1 MAG: 50S ribosomal protein L5 [Candidatus Beckwithbact